MAWKKHLDSCTHFCNLLHYVLTKVYEESLAPHRYVVFKGRSILIASSYNCAYYLLILNQTHQALPTPPTISPSRNAGTTAHHGSRVLVMGSLYHGNSWNLLSKPFPQSCKSSSRLQSSITVTSGRVSQ